MRKLYIENETGGRIALQGDTLFLWNPEGLGIAESRDYAEAQYGFRVPSALEYGQNDVSGVLVFKRGVKDPYTAYAEFVEWVQSAGELYMVYAPTSNRELYMDVYMDLLDLTEKTKYGTLECPVTFRATSPFHDRSPYIYVLKTDINQRPMRYTFRFPFRFSRSSSSGAIDIDVHGHFPAAVEMYINGAFASPVLTAKDRATGAEVGKLDLTGVSIEPGEQIYFTSRPNLTGVWKVSGGERVDIVDALDLRNNNFFTLPHGRGYTLTLTGDNDPQQATQHILRVHQYYKG